MNTLMASKLENADERGFALLEAIVFLVAFMTVAAYTIDFFTIIHTGIVGSIGARTYLFETLQHRSDIRLLRYSSNPQSLENYSGDHERFHGINDEEQDNEDRSQFPATGRALTRVNSDDRIEGQVIDGQLDSPQNKATTIYVKSGYGICVDADCKPDGG